MGCINCQEESGYKCYPKTGTTPAYCETVCGDKIVAGNEKCDLGSKTDGTNNNIAGSGCSPTCQLESGYYYDANLGVKPMCGDKIQVGT